LKQLAIVFAVALFAAALGAGGYAYYQSSVEQRTSLVPAPIIDGRPAQSTVKPSQFPPFTIQHGKLDADGLPTSNARLCVKAEFQCFTLATKTDSQIQYYFGLDPKAQRVALEAGGSVIFFSGIFSGGGSGFLESFALLQYDNNGNINNLLPEVYIADGGDRHVWKLTDVSPMPVITFAEANWAEGEAHYGDKHFYTVSAYVYDPNPMKYTKRLEYVTSQKYSDEEDPKLLSVLANEKPTIVGKLTGLMLANTEQSTPAQSSPVPKVSSPQPNTESLNRQLVQCILPKAQYSQYSSFDGGRSAEKLLDEDCPNESFAWEEKCEADGQSSKDCFLKQMILAQAALKSFGK
jgi:hypothetical protein